MTHVLTAGQRQEAVQVPALLERGAVARPGRGRPRVRPDRAAGDQGYTGRPVRTSLRRRGIGAVIPRRKNKARRGVRFDRAAYCERNQIERTINRLKQHRAITTRSEKLEVSSHPCPAHHCLHPPLVVILQTGLGTMRLPRKLSADHTFPQWQSIRRSRLRCTSLLAEGERVPETDKETPAAGSDETPESLERATAERLSLIRYLFSVAEQQTRLPESVRSIALLTLHDVVELFLHVAAQHVNVPLGSGRMEFGEYFAKIAEADPVKRLTRQHQMRQLNAARIALKHQGVRTSGSDIENLRVAVSRFLSENTLLIFGVSLESVSVVDFIRFPIARKHLREAEMHLSEGGTGSAMIAIVQGFQSTIDEYEKEATQAHGRSPFSFAGDFMFDRSFFRYGAGGISPFGPRDQGQFEDKIVSSIESLAGAVKMLSLGLDYRRYARFRLLTPPAHLLPIPGKGGPQLHVEALDNWPPSQEDCQFCFEFTVDSTLQLQEVVFEKPSSDLGIGV
jgi:transposase